VRHVAVGRLFDDAQERNLAEYAVRSGGRGLCQTGRQPRAEGEPGVLEATVVRSIASVIAPARIELARIRLEDVFVGIVSAQPITADDERALRANLQGVGRDGAML
jgi:hypothetical protein